MVSSKEHWLLIPYFSLTCSVNLKSCLWKVISSSVIPALFISPVCDENKIQCQWKNYLRGGKYKIVFIFFCAIRIGLEDNKKTTHMINLYFDIFIFVSYDLQNASSRCLILDRTPVKQIHKSLKNSSQNIKIIIKA